MGQPDLDNWGGSSDCTHATIENNGAGVTECRTPNAHSGDVSRLSTSQCLGVGPTRRTVSEVAILRECVPVSASSVCGRTESKKCKTTLGVGGCAPPETQACGFIGINDSSNYWLGSVAVIAPLLDLRSPGFEPRSGQSFLFLQARVRRGGWLLPAGPRGSFNSSANSTTLSLHPRACSGPTLTLGWALTVPSTTSHWPNALSCVSIFRRREK
jgi:hypothetical protein